MITSTFPFFITILATIGDDFQQWIFDKLKELGNIGLDALTAIPEAWSSIWDNWVSSLGDMGIFAPVVAVAVVLFVLVLVLIFLKGKDIVET